MKIIKNIIFVVIPITLFIMLISYGISIIFGDNLSITYLQEVETESTFGTYKIFNWNQYLTNLTTTNVIKPFENLGNTFTYLIDPVKSIVNLVKNTSWWKLLVDPVILARILVNILILLTNIPIWLLNLAISIIQATNIIFGALLKLIGINTNANITLFNIFRSFNNWTLIPGIKALSW